MSLEIEGSSTFCLSGTTTSFDRKGRWQVEILQNAGSAVANAS